MASKAKRVKPKRRGQPATGKDPLVGVRLPHEMISALDRWAMTNQAASRSEAIRRLVESGLAGTQPARQRSREAASKALALAGSQIDKLIDPTATEEERQQRKRRLLKGPNEFREFRGDIPTKSKR